MTNPSVFVHPTCEVEDLRMSADWKAKLSAKERTVYEMVRMCLFVRFALAMVVACYPRRSKHERRRPPRKWIGRVTPRSSCFGNEVARWAYAADNVPFAHGTEIETVDGDVLTMPAGEPTFSAVLVIVACLFRPSRTEEPRDLPQSGRGWWLDHLSATNTARLSLFGQRAT